MRGGGEVIKLLAKLGAGTVFGNRSGSTDDIGFRVGRRGHTDRTRT